MASATLAQLRDQTIIDNSIEGNPAFPTTRLNRMINLAQRYVQTMLNGLGMNKWEVSQSITAGLTSASFASAALSPNVKTVTIGTTYFTNMLESPNSIRFISVDDGTNFGIAYPVSPDTFLEHLNNSYLAPSAKKPIFMRLANSVYLAPLAITSATAFYFRAVLDLSADTDVSEIPQEFEEFVVKKVGIEINNILGNLQDKQLALNQLDKDLTQAYERFIGKQNEITRFKRTDNAKVQ